MTLKNFQKKYSKQISLVNVSLSDSLMSQVFERRNKSSLNLCCGHLLVFAYKTNSEIGAN